MSERDDPATTWALWSGRSWPNVLGSARVIQVMRQTLVFEQLAWLEPGERITIERVARAAVRFDRMRAITFGQLPELGHFQRVVHAAGGSRRRGRNASVHWTIESLRALRRLNEPRLTLDRLAIGQFDQMGGGEPVPLDLFGLSQRSLGLGESVVLDPAHPGTRISITCTNRDLRRARFAIFLIGFAPDPDADPGAPASPLAAGTF